MKIIYLFFLLLVMISCGKDKDDGLENERRLTILEEKQPNEGNYRAILRPLNNHLSGYLPTGVAEVYIDGDDFDVLTLLDDDAKVMHIQNVHMGRRCPQISDDKNKDSFIDIKEAMEASGKVLISLDDDLLADKETDNYPKGRGFTYKENVSLKLLEEKIYLEKKQNLNLDGRVVIIQGASPSSQLGPTVSGTKGISKELSIPVVCGVLKRIN